MNNIIEKLGDAINKHLDDLMKLDTESDEMNRVIGNTVQLYKLYLEEEKLDLENSKLDADKSDKTERIRIEDEKLRLENSKLDADKSDKRRRLEFDRKKLLFDIGTAAAELVLPLTLYGVLSYIGFAREFDGVVTSDTLKKIPDRHKVAESAGV